MNALMTKRRTRSRRLIIAYAERLGNVYVLLLTARSRVCVCARVCVCVSFLKVCSEVVGVCEMKEILMKELSALITAEQRFPNNRRIDWFVAGFPPSAIRQELNLNEH